MASRRGADLGVCLPGPIRSRFWYKNDNPLAGTGVTGISAKREFEEEIYRWSQRLRVDDIEQFTTEPFTYDLIVPIYAAAGTTLQGTTAATNGTVKIPRSGQITLIDFFGQTTLAADNTNYVTFSATNVQNLGSGTVALLGAVAGNTTQVTGGSGWTANVGFVATLAAVPATYVTGGDVVKVTITPTGTLANTVNAVYARIRIRAVRVGHYSPQIVRTAGTPGVVPLISVQNGGISCVLEATSELQFAGITYGDQRVMPATKRGIFEARVTVATATVTNEDVIIGLGTNFNSTLASITKYVRFRLNGSMSLLIEGTDGTNTFTLQTPSRNAYTLTAGTAYLFTIDMRDLSKVRFFVEDTLIGTLNLSAFADSDLLQPTIGVRKSTGVTVPSLTIDWARLHWNRI